jgi:Dyp-type peroxidase family
MTSRRIREHELRDIQGNILRGYRLRNVAHLFATLSPVNVLDWRTALQHLAVTPEACSSKPQVTRNVGISYAGMALLAPQIAEKLDIFEAYALGMEKRARDLGDAPELPWDKWNARHIWISVHAATPERLRTEVERLQKELPGLLPAVLFAEAIADAAGNWLEPFGFRDDISQPAIEGAPNEARLVRGNGKLDAGRKGWLPIAAGEFLLGHLNERDRDVIARLATPIRQALANGTFAAFRELVQDTEQFSAAIAEGARTWNISPDVLKAKLVGRYPDGTPLAKAEGKSDFSYDDDPRGSRCPLGAHVRRVNPRLSGERRIIRRGVPFRRHASDSGKSERKEQGIYFVALNASLENQFEFMQQTWINKPVGALPGSRDPLVAEGNEDRRFAISPDALTHGDPILLALKTFVTCRGGQYYFMPSLSGLRQIVDPDHQCVEGFGLL